MVFIRINNFVTFIARYNNEIIAFPQFKMIEKAGDLINMDEERSFIGFIGDVIGITFLLQVYVVLGFILSYVFGFIFGLEDLRAWSADYLREFPALLTVIVGFLSQPPVIIILIISLIISAAKVYSKYGTLDYFGDIGAKCIRIFIPLFIINLIVLAFMGFLSHKFFGAINGVYSGISFFWIFNSILILNIVLYLLVEMKSPGGIYVKSQTHHWVTLTGKH